jgi:hypothetical protein
MALKDWTGHKVKVWFTSNAIPHEEGYEDNIIGTLTSIEKNGVIIDDFEFYPFSSIACMNPHEEEAMQ